MDPVYEVNDTWFVQFESEEKTQDTALWLRSQKFKDAPIKVALLPPQGFGRRADRQDSV